MIKFFRHIRQKLLTENKFSKYMLYAIGEIVLVVVGILIALQINNWNEQQKNDALEADYYCRLLEDVQQDHQQTLALIQQAENRLNASNQAVRLLLEKDTKRIEVGSQIARATKAIYIDFKPNNATFEDLKSANLNLLKDKEIVKALNNYYNNIESMKSIIMVNGKNAVDIAFKHTDNFANGDTEASLRHGLLKKGMEPDVLASFPIDSMAVLSKPMQQRLLNEALVYISSNTRQLELYNIINDYTASVTYLLQKQCGK